MMGPVSPRVGQVSGDDLTMPVTVVTHSDRRTPARITNNNQIKMLCSGQYFYLYLRNKYLIFEP